MWDNNIVLNLYDEKYKPYEPDIDDTNIEKITAPAKTDNNDKVKQMLTVGTELNMGIYTYVSDIEKIDTPADIDSYIIDFIHACEKSCGPVLYDKERNRLVFNIDNILNMFDKYKKTLINELNSLTVKDCSSWGKYNHFCNSSTGLGRDWLAKPIILYNGIYALDYIHALFTITGDYLVDTKDNKELALYIEGVYKFTYYN